MCDHDETPEANATAGNTAGNDAEYKNYCEYRADILKLEMESVTALDRLYLTFASVFFAVSLAFIDKIVPLAEARFPIIILFSWAAMSFTIIAVVISTFTSALSSRSLVQMYDRYYEKTGRFLGNEPDFQQEEDKTAHDLKVAMRKTFTTIITWCNGCACVLFVLGLLLQLAFIAINLYNLNERMPEARVQVELLNSDNFTIVP